ncbi:MAG: folate-binding protein YgfZ [Candidatus Pelagadaptatus aseana]
MIANFALLQTGEDAFTFKLSRDLLATFKASLDKYIVFSKAETQDLTDSYRLFGLTGEGIAPWLEARALPTPEVDACLLTDQAAVITHSLQQVECWLPQAHAKTAELTAACTEAAKSSWQLQDIAAGIGWVDSSTSEEFLPQMLNLDLPPINGISFKKGCYTGQEIVARMHYKGQTKRRLQHLQCQGQVTAEPGSELFGDTGKQSIGHVVNSQTTPEHTEMLAVVTLANAQSGNIYLDRETQVKLSTKPLPYAITTEQ